MTYRVTNRILNEIQYVNAKSHLEAIKKCYPNSHIVRVSAYHDANVITTSTDSYQPTMSCWAVTPSLK